MKLVLFCECVRKTGFKDIEFYILVELQPVFQLLFQKRP